MPPIMIRQLWSLIETTQAALLLNLDDSSLVQWLLHQFGNKQKLNAEETSILSKYIHSRLTLIRELAYDRSAANH